MLLVLILLILAIYQAHSATIKFDVSLASPNLELDCTYKLESNEILYRVILKKDGETFVSFDDSTKNKPTFTQIEGVTDVTLSGAGKVTIKNYQDSTWGIYSCNVYYDLKTDKKSNSNSKKKGKESKGTQSVSKKFRLKMKKCKATWSAYTGAGLPSGVWVTGANNVGTKLVFCRGKPDDNIVPGYLRDVAGTTTGQVECVFGYNGVTVMQSDFEILCGTGFEWVPLGDRNYQNPPPNAQLAGSEQQGAVSTYIGRCTLNGDPHLGKITGHLFIINNNEETSACDQAEIVICS